jgi:hypothetical protein
MAQAPVEDEHCSRKASGEQLVVLRAEISSPAAEHEEPRSGEQRKAYGSGNDHIPVIGGYFLPL